MKELPPDIILYNILPKLPVRTLIRCFIVSKQWHFFLKPRMFSDMHLNHVLNNDNYNHQKLLVLSERKFCTIDCEAPEDGLTASRPLPFNVSFENMRIITSFHGMVSVGITKGSDDTDREYCEIFLWNPLTSEYKTLSKTNSHVECYKSNGRSFGLYCTSCDDDYKLLNVTDDYDIYIYSLKSDSWRKVYSDFKCILTQGMEYWVPCSSLLDEKLYFLRVSSIQFHRNIPLSYTVITFDTKTEKLTEIAGPTFSHDRCTKVYSYESFTVAGGCIQLCVSRELFDRISRNKHLELWSMNGDGDWTNLSIYNVNKWFTKPLHLMRNGKWLTDSDNIRVFTKPRGDIFMVDLEKNIKVKLCSYPEGSDIHERGKCIETFVSSNQYIK